MINQSVDRRVVRHWLFTCFSSTAAQRPSSTSSLILLLILLFCPNFGQHPCPSYLLLQCRNGTNHSLKRDPISSPPTHTKSLRYHTTLISIFEMLYSKP